MAGLTADEARAELVRHLEQDARREAAHIVKRIEDEAREQAARRAQQIISEAIQRSAAEHVVETTVSVVDLPSDDMKGRIIGREGRNIRALELATGVDLIVDDTPGAVILSGFDPFRREIARAGLERLIADGRIHPARIEEVVEKVKAELERRASSGRRGRGVRARACTTCTPSWSSSWAGCSSAPATARTCLSTRKEVAFLAGIMARELGLDAPRRGAGRVPARHRQGDRPRDGGHAPRDRHRPAAQVRRERGGRSTPMAAHHSDYDSPSLEAVLVHAADAISAARPGARREILETYVKRLEKLEEIADSFKGVQKTFAIQAGREIRIIVDSEQVSDEEAVWLSKDIARRIEDELEYPGQIKVTVIRETRAVEFAR